MCKHAKLNLKEYTQLIRSENDFNYFTNLFFAFFKRKLAFFMFVDVMHAQPACGDGAILS